MRRFYQLALASVLLLATMIGSGSRLAAQQPFVLSKHSDFSTDDRAFSRADTLYILVTRPDIDYTNLKEMDFELKPRSGGNKIRGQFANNMDGTYTAWVDLSTTDASEVYWTLRIEIQDHSENKLDVRVPVTITQDGSAPAPDQQKKRVNVHGIISAVQGDSIQVKGMWIMVTDSTVIQRGNMSKSFSDLHAGLLVEVHAWTAADGSIIADRIQINEKMGGNDNEVEVKGFISSIGNDSLVVEGITFWVDSTTQVVGREEESKDFADLQVGDFVQVKAMLRDDGLLWATRIKMEDGEGFESEYEIEGPIEALSDTSITVAGVTFLVDDQTMVMNHDKGAIGFSALQVGDLVEVKGTFRDDGNLWAVKIKLEESEEAEIEVKGAIESVGEGSIVVAGMTFAIDSTTVIFGEHHTPADASMLQPGVFVEVKAFRQADGSLLAVRIKIEDEFKSKIEVKGAIQDLTASTITVFNTTFDVDSTTLILDHQKNPLTLADLQVGMIVEVKGVVRDGANPLAERIKVEEHEANEVEVNAAIDSLDTDAGMVYAGGQAFLVDDHTIIEDAQKQPLSFGDLSVGQMVEIKARRQPDGSLLALRIKVEDNQNPAVKLEVKGDIAAINGDTLVVEQTVFLTDANTMFLDRNNNAITLADFSVGEFVEVQAETQVDGIWLAKKVKKEDPVSMQGQVQTVGSGQMTVLNTTVQLTASTLIVGPFNTPLSNTAIQSGSNVIVQGTVTASGDVIASTVIVSTNTVTGVPTEDRAVSLPLRFVLEQNYPNPFNPQTSLRYRIEAQSPQRVILRVYNILGQQVATLVDRVQPAGSYSVIWNGRNDAGKLMPSGVYFAKLQVGSAAQVRRMIFSK